MPEALVEPCVLDCKAHPDEKGIETVFRSRSPCLAHLNCKAHPDEKGIETDRGRAPTNP